MNRSRRIHVLLLIVLASVLATTAQTLVMTDPRNSKKKLENAGPVIVSINANGGFKLGEKSMTLYRLRRALDAAMDERIPPERIIYVKAAAKVPFSGLVRLLRIGRTIGQDSFGLIPDEKDDVTEAILTKISLEKPRRYLKPNPLTLILSIRKNGQAALNGEAQTPSSLTKLLEQIFKEREVNGAYREGTNEVERTVFLAPSVTTTFEALLQAARLVKNAGADPIGIQIDKPQPMVIEITQIG